MFIKFQPTYPPNIYFKIYTRAPIVDMCACSPKDYTQQKIPAPSQIHNGRQTICAEDDHSGWYQRVENNGWRILSCKVIYSVIILSFSFYHLYTNARLKQNTYQDFFMNRKLNRYIKTSLPKKLLNNSVSLVMYFCH